MSGSWVRRPKADPERGFTLVEVAVAVAILGLALTALIALQTRLIDSYSRERNLQRAAVYAQYLMSLIEVQKDAPDLGSKGGDLERALREAGYFDDKAVKEDKESLEGWEYFRQVERFQIPFAENVPGLEDLVRKVMLEVSWGEGASDRYQLFYLMTPQNSAAGSVMGGGSPMGGTTSPLTPTSPYPVSTENR